MIQVTKGFMGKQMSDFIESLELEVNGIRLVITSNGDNVTMAILGLANLSTTRDRVALVKIPQQDDPEQHETYYLEFDGQAFSIGYANLLRLENFLKMDITTLSEEY